jgi:circadian clock protein KaiC
VIGKSGFDVAIARTWVRLDTVVSNERVSSGVARLDTMLGGGYYRGASVLITGFPRHGQDDLERRVRRGGLPRGERTMFVSFDSDGAR